MKRRAFLWVLALLTLIGLTSPTLSFAQDDEGDAEFTLNLGTLATKDTPWGKQLTQYKKMVETQSNNRIKVKLHFGGRKGDELSMVRQTHKGTLQAFGGSTGAMAEMIPDMAIFELPYLFKDTKEADTIIDNVITPEIAEILKENGFILYIMAENGFRNFGIVGDVSVKSPADLKKLKMRAQEMWTHIEMYRALGGNPVPMPVSEVTTSLTTGGIDGFDNTPLYAFAAGWQKQIQTWIVSDHIYQPALIVYSKTWFDSLPPELQEVVLNDQKVQTKMGRKLVRDMNTDLIKQLEDDPAKKVYRLSDAEKAAFAKAAASVHDQFPSKSSARGAELLKKVKAAKK